MMVAAIRVLFVDDKSSNLDLAKMFKNQSGDFIITTVPNATEAIRLLHQAQFDAIIYDYQMPETNSGEFLKAIRARVDKTPLIIITEKGREEEMIKAFRAGANGIFRDVTERKLAEEALIAANKKLKLLSSITRHDILNQLVGLDGYFTILKKKQTDPTLNEYIDKARTVAKRISAVIRFTKEYENLGIDTPVWQDCRTLVDTVAKQVEIGQIIVKNNVPAGTEIFADRLFDRVFFNLFDNSLLYGGDQMKTIRISSQESDTNLIILYENDGVEIAAEDKKRLFSHGFGKHTGLGLFLSQEILSITGITIAENSIPEKGVRFVITVPPGMWRKAGNII
jgi:signal transduction histidine kinase